MAAKIGRPTVPDSRKKVVATYSLPPTEIKWVKATAGKQGVPLSQVVFDAIQTLKGEIQETIANLRAELADQKAMANRLSALAGDLQSELKRLQSSQDFVATIVNPYGSSGKDLNKIDLEKARTVRAIINNTNEMAFLILERRAEGDDGHPLMDIHRDGLKAWGTWSAFYQAVKAAKAATQ